MHPGLRHLLRLQWRSLGRRWFRGLRTWRGCLFSAVGMGLFGLWIVPALLGLHHGGAPTDLNQMRTTVLPVGMFLLTVLHLVASASQTSVRFTPAEVDFLFGGPFSRRQLLAYKLASTVPGLFLAATMFSVLMIGRAGSWLSAIVGFFLALAFLQLLAMCIALAAGLLGELAYNRARKAALVGVAVAIAAALYQALASLPAGAGAMPALAHLGETVVGRCLLAPFAVFARAITAESFLDLAVWGACAALIDAALAAVVFALDVNFLEAETAASRRFYERMRRVQQTGGTLGPAPGRAFGRVPLLPRWRGAGPVLRRQLIAALRGLSNTPRALFVLLVTVAMTAAMLPTLSQVSPAAMIGPAFFLTVFCTRLFAFDFRNDLEHLDWLKSMPVSPWAVTCGQLAVPAAMVTLMQWAILAFGAVWSGSGFEALAGAAALAPPMNVLWFAMENAYFLAFPVRVTPVTAGSFQHIGREMVGTFVKMFVLGLVGGVVGGAAAAVYFLLFRSIALALAVAWIMLSLAALGFACVTAWTFRRFDVATETPA